MQSVAEGNYRSVDVHLYLDAKFESVGRQSTFACVSIEEKTF